MSRRWPIRDRRWAIPDRQSLVDPAMHSAGPWPGDVRVPGGRWRLGSTSADGFIFDNEKWAHEVAVAPFRIARAPVTNAEFAAFVEAGGYRQPGLLECRRAGLGGSARRAERPVYWRGKDGSSWTWLRYGKIEQLRPMRR